LIAYGIAVILSFQGLACENKIERDTTKLFTFEVNITTNNFGSAEVPLPFTRQPIPMTIDIRAIDEEGQLADWFNEVVNLRIAPRGNFPTAQKTEVQLVNGVASGVAVEVEKVHSTAAIWVEHLGTDDHPGSYATGLSQTITTRNPTLRNVQEVDPGKYVTSTLRGNFVNVDLENRIAVVTGVMSDGYYITDTTEPGFAYSSIFVYSHNYPDLQAGTRITKLSGSIEEFYGFTELSYPTWREAAELVAVPDPVLITADLVDNDDAMEQYEGALVEVDNVTICPTGSDYTTYG